VKINGETHFLWRAVDHDGEVLESYVTKRRDRKAALKNLRKSMKRYGKPKLVITDRLRSYGAAMIAVFGPVGSQIAKTIKPMGSHHAKMALRYVANRSFLAASVISSTRTA